MGKSGAEAVCVYATQSQCATRQSQRLRLCRVKAKFHYTGPTGPDWTRTDFLRPGSPRNSVGSVRVSDKVRAGPVGSGRARVVEFSVKQTKPT